MGGRKKRIKVKLPCAMEGCKNKVPRPELGPTSRGPVEYCTVCLSGIRARQRLAERKKKQEPHRGTRTSPEDFVKARHRVAAFRR